MAVTTKLHLFVFLSYSYVSHQCKESELWKSFPSHSLTTTLKISSDCYTSGYVLPDCYTAGYVPLFCFWSPSEENEQRTNTTKCNVVWLSKKGNVEVEQAQVVKVNTYLFEVLCSLISLYVFFILY